MPEDDLSYYERRAREESAAADAAVDPTVASARRLLAIQYEAEARELRRMVKPEPAIA